MHVKATLKSYEKVEFSLTLTAPVEDWRAMQRLLHEKFGGNPYPWPISGFSSCLDKMLNDLDKTHAYVLAREEQV